MELARFLNFNQQRMVADEEISENGGRGTSSTGVVCQLLSVFSLHFSFINNLFFLSTQLLTSPAYLGLSLGHPYHRLASSAWRGSGADVADVLHQRSTTVQLPFLAWNSTEERRSTARKKLWGAAGASNSLVGVNCCLSLHCILSFFFGGGGSEIISFA